MQSFLIAVLPSKARAFFFWAGIVAVQCPPLANAATPRPMRVTYLSNSVTMAPLWMAKETGAIAKEGLDVEILSMTASVAVPALLAGELDAIQMSAAPVLNAALRGHDLVFVCGLLNTMIWNFYGRPGIASAEALRGKIVGTDRPGTPGAYATQVSLKKIGLGLKDVQLFPIGGSAFVIAALNATNGAWLARMSGSGATCFAIYENTVEAGRAAEKLRRDHPGWWVHAGTLS